MPKEYFSTQNLTPLSSLNKSAHIHFIGIAGVAMGNLAIALSEMGYQVTGSDKEFYEPMGSALREASIFLYEGYSADNLKLKPDLCVIGNAISYGHPEVAVIEEDNLDYTCFPRLLFEAIIRKKTSIVACGTHGKSTTTAMLASTLERMHLQPSYFIGGKVQDLTRSVCVADGEMSVVEGDEYDDVFFSKKAKFMHYKPDICIINALEFDHADLYQDFNAVKNAFYELAKSLPAGAHLIYNADSAELVVAVSEWAKELKCKIHSFGRSENASLRIVNREVLGLNQKIQCQNLDLGRLDFTLKIPGEFNARNAAACILAAHVQGLNIQDFTKELSQYIGVKRRQELRLEKNGRILIEDFAHHPTAVRETVNALREAYPSKKLWAVYEPRSNTSRLNVFYQDYLKTFNSADQILMTVPVKKELDKDKPLLDVEELVKDLNQQGNSAKGFADVSSLEEYLLENVGNNDLIVLMSNGSFGGLVGRLIERL
jgi:UDP-N-acetylmuramate: L-alanyl-gamma-D-glutamyl-meso-diaminopimelate ligase